MIDQIKKDFSSFLQTSLNESQHEAATQKEGALLVIAGAGSGKTRVITSRIINLILHEQVDPRSIIALTFTNKAAGEMKERILKVLGTHYSMPFVGTFHSYCLLLLRSNPMLLPFPQFSILDADDQLSLVKKIIKKNSLEKYATASQIIYQISNLKNKSHLNIATDDEVFTNPIIKEIYHAYEAEKSAAHAFDFDDLILNVLQLFSKQAIFKESFHRRVRHVLVDEYQDTSHAQHQLLKDMSLNKEEKFHLDSLCAVGDEDQSIYSWRGATVTNMLKFQKDFAPVTKVKIEQNYRSVQPVLDAANSIIAHNKLRNPKNLWSDKKAKNRIMLLQCRSGEQESESIARFLQSIPSEKKLNSIAILYRTHFQSRVIEEALIYHSIPYRIVGGIRFYERKEIKDLLAYLRLIVNPYDKISLLRIINCPQRGLGQKFEELLMNEWNRNPFFTFKQLLEHLCSSDNAELTPLKMASVKGFINIFDTLDKEQSVPHLIDAILDKTEYLNYLRTAFDAQESDAKRENVREFLQSISNFELTFTGNKGHLPSDDPFYVQSNKATLENFLFDVSLMQEKIGSDNQEEQVQMMTLHAAKGLEFDTVFITGLEEGLLPSAKSLTTNEELEEERRLFYVGITRAEEYLVLSHASYRNSFGTIVDQVPSRFVGEMDKKLVQSYDLEKMHPTQLPRLFKSWLGYETPDDSDGLMTFSAAKTTASPVIKKARVTSFTAQKKSTFTNEVISASAPWYKNQNVRHKSFGQGIVTKVEKSGENEYFVTAVFKAGQKKILSSFLEKI